MKKIFMLIIVFISMLFFKNNVYAYKEYKVGDLIKYRDEYYFVIADSDEKQNYVTLLKYEPLTQEEIYKYSGGEFDEQYISPARWCNSAETGGDCGYSVNYYNDFKDSYIYLIVNNWASEFSDDLISVDGYKSRIIFIEELINNLGYEEAGDDFGGYPKTDDTPFWVYNYNYWTRFMDNSNNRNEITPYYRVGERLDGA